ncbi:MAG: TIGR04076 family protein [Chloroflexota bacterium]
MPSFFELYDIRVTVDEIRGDSVCGMAVGDYFEITESSKLRIPEGKHFCMYALNSVIPLIAAKQRELSENDWLSKDSQVVCPDPEEQLIMTIERIGKQQLDSDDLT